MQIVCPHCDATYDVPDAMLADGARLVRCAKCGHEWTPTAISQAPLPPDEPEPEADAAFDQDPAAPPEAEEMPPIPPAPHGRQEPRLNPLRPRQEARLVPPPPEEPPPPPRGRAVAVAAWALSILVLAAAGTAAVAWRTQVMAAWPPSERVFAALGLG